MRPPVNLQMSKDLKIEKKSYIIFSRKINYKETQNPPKKSKNQQKTNRRIEKGT